jgi:DNA-directed RNA polymerase subunit RPC12/RpoP
VRSFIAPYVCDKCNREEDKLLDVRTHFPNRDLTKLPDFKCEQCQSAMEFDDIPERYLAFLAEP